MLRQHPIHPQLKSYFTSDKQRYIFYFDLSPNIPPYKLEIYLEARTLVQDALIVAIEDINRVVRKEGIQLIGDLRFYKARLVGRNFRPKMDMPCLSLYQKICDFRIQQIAVQILNKEKAIRRIYPIIQISEEITHLQLDPKEEGEIKQVRKVEGEESKVVEKQGGGINEAVEQRQQRKILEVVSEQKKIIQESLQDKKQQGQVTIEAKEIKQVVLQQQMKETIIEQLPKEQQKPQKNVQQPKNPIQTNTFLVEYFYLSKILQQMYQQKKELLQLKTQIKQQKKDLREQRRNLREQRSQMRQIRKQLTHQSNLIQRQRKELEQLTQKLQEEKQEQNKRIQKKNI